MGVRGHVYTLTENVKFKILNCVRIVYNKLIFSWLHDLSFEDPFMNLWACFWQTKNKGFDRNHFSRNQVPINCYII